MGWDVDGVTGESRYLKLLYSEPAETLLAQFERDVGNRQAVRSLYMRRVAGTDYQRVFSGDDRTSARDVVCSSRSAIAVFSVWVTTERGGHDPSRIARLDLRTGVVTTALEMKTFRDKNDGGWVSDLIASDDSGSIVLCRTAAFRPTPTEKHPNMLHVDYSLSRLDLDTGEFDRITLLRHIGF